MKIHNLYCVKNTPLADQVASGEVRLMERDEYVQTVVDFMELLPPTMIVDRISRRRPARLFHWPDVVPRQTGGQSGRLGRVRARGTRGKEACAKASPRPMAAFNRPSSTVLPTNRCGSMLRDRLQLLVAERRTHGGWRFVDIVYCTDAMRPRSNLCAVFDCPKPAPRRSRQARVAIHDEPCYLLPLVLLSDVEFLARCGR